MEFMCHAQALPRLTSSQFGAWKPWTGSSLLLPNVLLAWVMAASLGAVPHVAASGLPLASAQAREVSGGWIWVLADPSASGEQIGRLFADEQWTEAERRDGWVRLDKRGWVKQTELEGLRQPAALEQRPAITAVTPGAAATSAPRDGRIAIYASPNSAASPIAFLFESDPRTVARVAGEWAELEAGGWVRIVDLTANPGQSTSGSRTGRSIVLFGEPDSRSSKVSTLGDSEPYLVDLQQGEWAHVQGRGWTTQAALLEWRDGRSDSRGTSGRASGSATSVAAQPPPRRDIALLEPPATQRVSSATMRTSAPVPQPAAQQKPKGKGGWASFLAGAVAGSALGKGGGGSDATQQLLQLATSSQGSKSGGMDPQAMAAMVEALSGGKGSGGGDPAALLGSLMGGNAALPSMPSGSSQLGNLSGGSLPKLPTTLPGNSSSHARPVSSASTRVDGGERSDVQRQLKEAVAAGRMSQRQADLTLRCYDGDDAACEQGLELARGHTSATVDEGLRDGWLEPAQAQLLHACNNGDLAACQTIVAQSSAAPASGSASNSSARSTPTRPTAPPRQLNIDVECKYEPNDKGGSDFVVYVSNLNNVPVTCQVEGSALIWGNEFGGSRASDGGLQSHHSDRRSCDLSPGETRNCLAFGRAVGLDGTCSANCQERQE